MTSDATDWWQWTFRGSSLACGDSAPAEGALLLLDEHLRKLKARARAVLDYRSSEASRSAALSEQELLLVRQLDEIRAASRDHLDALLSNAPPTRLPRPPNRPRRALATVIPL